MPRTNNNNNSYSPKRPTFRPLNPHTSSINQPFPYTPSIQNQPRSFFGNIVDGFAFSTGATIARNIFGTSDRREVKEIREVKEVKVAIDCSEYYKCYEMKEGDKFLYNDCIKKLPNKLYDYDICQLK